MSIIGHLIALIGLYCCFRGEILIGSVIFAVGGFLARKLHIGPRSAGVVLFVASIAYGYNNAYSASVFCVIVVAFAIACLPGFGLSDSDDEGWGFSRDLFSSGSDGESGGDGGGD